MTRDPAPPDAGDPPSPTLHQLHAARGGDPHGVGEVFERYGCHVRQWVRAAGIPNEQDVEDLAQEVWVRLLAHLRTTEFASSAKFRAWVRTVAENLARDRQRRDLRNPARRHRESLALPGGAPPEPVANHTGPLTQVDRAERARERQARIDKLSGPKRDLVAMREKQGMTFPEIAAAQNARAAALGIRKPKTEDGVRRAYDRIVDEIGPPVDDGPQRARDD